MKQLLLCITAVSFLAGCITTEKVNAGFQTLAGKDISTVYPYIGHPDDVKSLTDDQKMFVWRHVASASIPMYTTQTTTGYDNYGNTYYGTTSGMSSMAYAIQCEAKVVTDSNNRIISWSFNGDNDGCYALLNNIQKLSN